MNYNHGTVRSYVSDLGMKMDEVRLKEFDTFAKNEGFNQKQFDAAVYAHAKLMKFYFTPSSYNYVNRVKIALFFLFSRK